jgi:hypothetical protein
MTTAASKSRRLGSLAWSNVHLTGIIATTKERADDRSRGRKTPFAAASSLLSDEATLDSFVLSLQARGRAKATLSTYSEAIENWRRFAGAMGMPPLLALSGEHLQAFFKQLNEATNLCTA